MVREIIEEIESEVSDFKNSGNQTIDIDNLLKYLADLKNNAIIQPQDLRDEKRFKHEKELEKDKADIQFKLADLAIITQSSTTISNSILETAQSALKSAILINGGAAIALLAFIGNIWSIEIDKHTVGSLVLSVSQFAYGALAAATGAGLRYLSQDFYAQSFQKMISAYTESLKTGNPVSTPENKSEKIGNCFKYVAIFLAVFAYIFFYMGIKNAGDAFYNHFDNCSDNTVTTSYIRKTP